MELRRASICGGRLPGAVEVGGGAFSLLVDWEDSWLASSLEAEASCVGCEEGIIDGCCGRGGIGKVSCAI
jgi:hypothetical protein